MKKLMTTATAALCALLTIQAFGDDAELLNANASRVATGTVDAMMAELKKNDGYTLRLIGTGDCRSTAVHTLDCNATIDLNGKNLYIDCSGTGGKPWVTLSAPDGTTLTIKNGSFYVKNTNIYSASGSTSAAVGLAQNAGGDLYIEDLTTTMDTRYPTIEGIDGNTYVKRCMFGDGTTARKFSGISAAGGYIEVSDTTIVATGSIPYDGQPNNHTRSAPMRVSGHENSKGTIDRVGSLKVLSGTYETQVSGGNVVQTCTSGGDIEITGGTFKGPLRLDGPNDGWGAKGSAKISGGTFNDVQLLSYIYSSGGSHAWNRYTLTGGDFSVDPSKSPYVDMPGYEVTAVQGASGTRYLVTKIPTTAEVSVVAGNDKIKGGKFAVGGVTNAFGTVVTADIGATVTITEIDCDPLYMPDYDVGYQFTVPRGGKTLTVTGVAPVADVHIEYDGVTVFNGQFTVEGIQYDFGDTAESVAIGEIVTIDWVDVDPGWVPNYKAGDTIVVPKGGLWITVTAQKQTGVSLIVKAGANVTGGSFTVGSTAYAFGTTARTVPAGETVTITSVNYALGYEPDGTYVKNYSATVPADATWEVTGKVVPAGEDPVLPQDVTPTEAGITNPAFEDAQPVEVKDIVKWQATYQEDGANVNLATFDTVGKPTNDQAAGYLLDCAPTAEGIAAAKESFSAEIAIGADGTPVVNVEGESPDATTYGNGTLIKLGAPAVTGPWGTDLTGAHFFKFELVK